MLKVFCATQLGLSVGSRPCSQEMPKLEKPLRELLTERMKSGDPFLNYCHWPYDPPASGSGKLRPSVLLYKAVNEMPHSTWVTNSLQAIQRGIGDFRSVYGIKRIADQWALEIYIYDYERQDRLVSIARLQEATGGLLKFPQTVDPRLPYFMFSFDLTENAALQNGVLDVVHVYIGNPGSQVSSGIAYEFSASGRQLENFYFFFDAQKHQKEIVDKLECSVYCDAWRFSPDDLYRPELRDCHTICLANKRTCDTIYFSGVNIDQLLFFLNWQQYPDDYIRFVQERHHELDHLLYDVGVDYRANGAQIEFVKHGFYGVF